MTNAHIDIEDDGRVDFSENQAGAEDAADN